MGLKSLKSRAVSYLESLRFPWLLLVAVLLFVINLFVPDALPFVDEILLAVIAAILARVKRRRGRTEPASEPVDTPET